MALLSKVIPGLYNGVSQQPAGIRLDTQCELQENCYPTLAKGLSKRPSAEFLAKLDISAPCEKPYSYTINRDQDEKYILVVTGDETYPLDVFTLDGTKMSVRYGYLDSEDLSFTADDSVKSYVTVEDPRENLDALTLADYTILVNKTQTCSMSDETASGTVAATVQSYDKLPTQPTVDNIYKVAGDRYDDFSAYFLKYDGEVYVECPEPGVSITLDETSMPHALVRTGANEMTFTPITWNERLVGNDTINPLPSFIGTQVTDVFMFKNRLGFLCGENLTLSRSGDFFNFFAKTALEILDDDPIDVAVSSEQVTILRHAISFNESLLLLSDQLQFSLHSTSNLTPSTTASDITTRYPADPNCVPVGAGANVYFASPQSQHMSIREYFVQPDSLVNDAANITAHVPEYLPVSIHTMVSAPALEALLVASDDEPRTLYLYKYYWQGNEKVQSSWGKWTFDGDIKSLTLMDSTVYVIIQKDDEQWLESITLESKTTDSLPFRVHLDHLVQLDGTYSSDTGYTTWDLPYTLDVETYVTAVESSTGLEVVNTERPSSTTVRALGDHTDTAHYLGVNYEMRYRFTEWTMRDSNANVDILEGRLQVRNLMLAYHDTGYFRVEVTPYRRDTLTTEFTGNVIGESLIGSPTILTGKQKFPIRANSQKTTVDIVNDTYLPSHFQNASWEGLFHKRNRSV